MTLNRLDPRNVLVILLVAVGLFGAGFGHGYAVPTDSPGGPVEDLPPSGPDRLPLPCPPPFDDEFP